MIIRHMLPFQRLSFDFKVNLFMIEKLNAKKRLEFKVNNCDIIKKNNLLFEFHHLINKLLSLKEKSLIQLKIESFFVCFGLIKKY